MNIENLIDEALHLKPQERYLLVENLINSLNEPNEEINEMWIKEAQNRLKAYRSGKLETVSYQDVFGA